MKNLLSGLMTLLVLSTSALAAPKDVVPKKLKHGSTYIRVTKIKNNRVKFEKCVKGYEETSCQRLGKKSSYSIKELESQRSTENWQIGGAILADVLLVAGAAFGGGAGLGTLAGTGSGFSAAAAGAGGAIIGGGIGIGVGVWVTNAVDVLNPAEQTRQAKTLNSDILQDKTVVVDSIDEYAERLELVLNKID